MPIGPFLNGARFDPETKRVLGVAFEMVCIAVRTEGSDDTSPGPSRSLDSVPTRGVACRVA